MSRPLLLFAPATYNLAETTRAIEIAKKCRRTFEVVFISYGGTYEYLIKHEGFSVETLHPLLTTEKIKHVNLVDRGGKFAPMFSTGEIELQVRSELQLLRRLNPVAVICTYNYSTCLACHIAGVKLILVTQSTWLISQYFKLQQARHIDEINFYPILLLPRAVRLVISLWLYKTFTYLFFVRPHNQVMRKFGYEPFTGIEDLWRGDYNLLAEPEDFCPGITVPANHYFIGPLLGYLEAPIPDAVRRIPAGKKVIYLAMGSSGQRQVLMKLLKILSGTEYIVIAPIRRLLNELDVKTGDNIIITDLLPALKVNKIADLALIHGGIGTVLTSALAGKPVIGIAMQPEQEANLDCLVSKGCAVRIRRNEITRSRILSTIQTLLENPEWLANAQRYRESVENSIARHDIEEIVRMLVGIDPA